MYRQPEPDDDTTPLPISWEDYPDAVELGVKLGNWHAGQWTGVYAVGSSWRAMQRAPAYLVGEALRELRQDLAKRKGKRDPDTRELRELVAALSGMVEKKPAASSSSSASKLPALFQNLTPRDWGHIRATAATQRAGDEEAVMTSVGYLDVGKLRGGLAYIGAMTFDANGGGGLSYRKVMQPQWGR